MSNPVEMQQPVETPGVGGLGRLLASTGVSIAGQGMVIAAVPLLAASITRNPIGVSLTVAASYAAWLTVGLPAGALVDRWPRRRTMVLADLVRAVLLALLAVAVLTDHASLPLLVVVVFLVGVAGCFFDPAAQAAIPMVVGRDPDSLARANGRLWSLDLVGRSLIGPPLGAALFALAAALPFVVNAGTFVISALLLTGLGALASPALAGSKERVHASVREGISFLVHHPELRALTIGMASFNLAYNIAFAPLVLFAQDRLHLGERGFGLLLAMVAVGGLVGAWVAPRLGRRITSLQAYALGLAVQGLAWGSHRLVAEPLGRRRSTRLHRRWRAWSSQSSAPPRARPSPPTPSSVASAQELAPSVSEPRESARCLGGCSRMQLGRGCPSSRRWSLVY